MPRGPVSERQIFGRTSKERLSRNRESQERPPILFLHGFTGRGSSWRSVLQFLPEGFETWCPDLLGHDPGAEVDPAADFSSEIARLVGGLEVRGLHEALLVGYSLGARVALGLLHRHPQRFRAALLIGVNPGLPGAEERRERESSDERLARMLEELGIEAFVDFWQELPLFANQKEWGPELWQEQRALRLRHRASGLAASLRALGLAQMPPDWREVHAIDLPLGLMVGERDEKFHGLAMEMIKTLPRGALHVIPGAGHNVTIETPEKVAQAILALESASASD